MSQNYMNFCNKLDLLGFYHRADLIENKLIKFSQQIDPSKIEYLSPTKTEVQANPSKYYDVGQVNKGFKIGPNDPPQVVPLKDQSGITHNILVLHGSPDGRFLISSSSNQLYNADKQEFDQWRTQKGYANYPWVSCYSGNVASSGNMNRLLKGTSKFELSTALLPDNSTHLLIKSA